MDPKFMQLNGDIARIVKTPTDQGRIVATAVAMVVASGSMLPSSPVTNIPDYFAGTVAETARNTISELGEGVVFSSQLAMEYTCKFWKLRYYAAHPINDGQADISFLYDLSNVNQDYQDKKIGLFDFTSLWCGAMNILSCDDAEFLNKYKVEILQIIARFPKITPEVEGEEGAGNDGL